MRGKAADRSPSFQNRRITPAYAGKSLGSSFITPAIRITPPMRGKGK